MNLLNKLKKLKKCSKKKLSEEADECSLGPKCDDRLAKVIIYNLVNNSGKNKGPLVLPLKSYDEKQTKRIIWNKDKKPLNIQEIKSKNNNKVWLSRAHTRTAPFTLCKVSEKSNTSIPRQQPDRRTKGQIPFIESFPPWLGLQKNPKSRFIVTRIISFLGSKWPSCPK